MLDTFSDFVRLFVAAAAGAACVTAAEGSWAEDLTPEAKVATYDAVAKKSILELQPFRTEMGAILADGTPLRFVTLNPEANGWFLVTIGEGRNGRVYHLENPHPTQQSVTLTRAPSPVLIFEGQKGSGSCAPWEGELAAAAEHGLPFAPICDGRLFLRNRVSGSATSLERTTDFLRDHVWGGETVVRFVGKTFFKDANRVISSEVGVGVARPVLGPMPAPLKTSDDARTVISVVHDFGLTGTEGSRMIEGTWYPVTGLDGAYVSAIRPRSISDSVLRGPGEVSPLDGIEAGSTNIFVAFDLDRFDLGFAMGTDHPRLDWSPRPPASVRPRGLPGPDGVSSPAPLVMLGMVPPNLTDRTVATFTAGFKRQHGAFKWGPYSTVNFGSHYGFIENGVILSKLQPGLSTIYTLTDGMIGMKTWTEADDILLPRIRFARQNGVPLVHRDPETGVPVPGDLVTRWGPGNWSGSADAELRTLRAGACTVSSASGGRYLVYGYFSTATPSAMARTFQAYGCDYAMLLDMNALEHTYLALYVPMEGKVHIEHIVPGMGLVDRKDRQGNVVPRFLGYPDNRDLFYLTRKE